MSVTGTLRGVAAPKDLWESSAVAGLSVVDGLVYRSNLLGADRALANVGGGNTSAKETTTDHVGRRVRVLWVKGSGTDLATITADGFAGLRLDELLRLEDRGELDDAAMVDVSPALRRAPRSTAAVDRDAASRVRARGARRPHPSGCGDRLDVDTEWPATRGRCVRRRDRVARLPASGVRHVSPHRGTPSGASRGASRAARAARARDMGRKR